MTVPRCDPANLVLLCTICHHWAHSKENVNHQFIGEGMERQVLAPSLFDLLPPAEPIAPARNGTHAA